MAEKRDVVIIGAGPAGLGAAIYTGRALMKTTVLERKVEELPPSIRDNENVDEDKTFTAVVYRVVDGQAVVTPIKMGRSDDTHIIIESGLTEDDVIIIGPYKVLEELKHEQ